MRAEPGLVWHPYESSGFWAATRHADVKAVSMSPKVFSSALGHTNLWDLEADALAARRSIIDTDAPDHTRLRRLVSKAFSPNSIREWEVTTRSIAAELLDGYVGAGGGDWVGMVAAPLPIRVILSILGVPVSDSDYLVELSNYLIEGTGDRPTLPVRRIWQHDTAAPAAVRERRQPRPLRVRRADRRAAPRTATRRRGDPSRARRGRR